jgi:hypothetical protein
MIEFHAFQRPSNAPFSTTEVGNALEQPFLLRHCTEALGLKHNIAFGTPLPTRLPTRLPTLPTGVLTHPPYPPGVGTPAKRAAWGRPRGPTASRVGGGEHGFQFRNSILKHSV